MSSSGVKFFSSILAYGLVPLLIAAHSNKVSYLVVLDLTVWLIAVAALCYLVKAPWELWFLAKAKTKELLQREKNGENVKEAAADLERLEFRMYYIGMATPFLAVGGWHFLAQWIAKYGLHAMTELVHPYFILIVGIMAGLFPVHKYYTNMKNNLAVSSSATVNKELQYMFDYIKQKQDVIDNLQLRIEAEVLKNETIRVKLEQEVKSLRKEMKMLYSKKSDDTHQFERRLLSVENQLEFSQLLLKEGTQKGFLDSFVPGPLKVLYKK